jgi:DNA polymerase
VTKEEKTTAALFLDLTDDYLDGGYRKHREPYECTGDPPTGTSGAFFSESGEKTPGAPESAATADTAPENAVPAEDEDSLEKVAEDIGHCTRCGLCKTRTNTVPGEGVPRPLVMVIGEGPGADEDATGRPFVGRAGQLLDRMLDSRGKIGLSRTRNCYIANVVKCRPPGNRNPQPDEIIACVPFLARQITILKPTVILALGNTAAKTLLDNTEGITRLRGLFTVFSGPLFMSGKTEIPLLPTFHPSALLRDQSLKTPVWEDLKTLRAKLCELNRRYAAEMANIPL